MAQAVWFTELTQSKTHRVKYPATPSG